MKALCMRMILVYHSHRYLFWCARFEETLIFCQISHCFFAFVYCWISGQFHRKKTRLYWPSGWELGIGGKCGVGGGVGEGGEVWWWAGWTRHSEIKRPEAEADRCPGERRPMVRTRVIFVISFSGKLVTCLFHRRADNMVVERGSIFSNKTSHYHSFIILREPFKNYLADFFR